MRRYEKKQLLEKIQILHEAHDCVKTLMLNEQDTAEFLADCQNLAIEIGTVIEELEGEGTKTVQLLESYCELLYHIANRKFPVSPSTIAESVKKELKEQIELAEESLQKDIKEQQIIAFFPYKASMWDSMETIWKKYQQDSNVQTMVVVLPYDIKDDNGKTVRKCYEGKDFPGEVPIINYEDFLENKFYVDIAIYHNPYDDTNKITEVDSRFFTSKLHDYAHTLVYIPYYVLVDKPAVTFVLAPGVKNADYVILQDEEIVEEFQRWYPKEKDKFLPLGSPKIDKAIEMNAIPKEDLNIPQEWKDRIRGKKVLFYNTHLINFYDANRDFIGKLKEVFATIQGLDNVVLWWRPHPLSDDMEFSTQQVERFQEYEALVEWYKQEDIGIYDDTPNLHEAIAVSDAYYGDGSSVVKLFQAVGKPVMLQHIKSMNKVWYEGMLEETPWLARNTVWTSDGLGHLEAIWHFLLLENELWYITYYNCLYKLNIKTGVNTKIVQLDEDILWSYKAILYAEGKIVLLPYYGDNMVIFDIKTGQVKIEELTTTEQGTIGYCTGQVYQDKVILVRWDNRRKMLCYSLKEGTFVEIKSINDKVKDAPSLALTSCLLGTKVYFVEMCSNKLWIYDIEKDLEEEYQLTDRKIGFACVIAVKNGVFAIGYDEHYAIYIDVNNGNKVEFYFSDMDVRNSNNIWTLSVDENKVYAVPFWTQDIFVFDIDRGEVKKNNLSFYMEKNLEGLVYMINGNMCVMPTLEDNRIYFSDGREWDLNDREVIEKFVGRKINSGICFEKEGINLETYLRHV